MLLSMNTRKPPGLGLRKRSTRILQHHKRQALEAYVAVLEGFFSPYIQMSKGRG